MPTHPTPHTRLGHFSKQLCAKGPLASRAPGNMCFQIYSVLRVYRWIFDFSTSRNLNSRYVSIYWQPFRMTLIPSWGSFKPFLKGIDAKRVQIIAASTHMLLHWAKRMPKRAGKRKPNQACVPTCSQKGLTIVRHFWAPRPLWGTSRPITVWEGIWIYRDIYVMYYRYIVYIQ